MLSGWILLVFISCNEKIPHPELTDFQKFQNILDHNIELYGVKGVSAAVKFQDQSIWYGTSGISYGTTSVSDQMVFCIGSITKTFIAALCLQLAEEGVFSLDDALHDWLPDMTHIDHAITIRQLLNNTSGISEVTDKVELWDAVLSDPERTWTPEEVISSYLGEPYADPGSGWYYSNTNYILLGKIISNATGNTVSSELRQRFFGPFGLDQTFFDGEEIIPVQVVHGWFDWSGEGDFEDISVIPRTGIYSVLWTSAAVFSSAKDLVVWSSSLVEGHVLGPSAMDQMFSIYGTMPGNSNVGCGMGIFLVGAENDTGMELIGYTGRTFGYLSAMFYVQDHGISVAVTLNQDHVACLDAITTELILETIDPDH